MSEKLLPWQTPEFLDRMRAGFEADAPHFQCSECLSIVPTYLGRYPHEGNELCHACFAAYVYMDEEGGGDE